MHGHGGYLPIAYVGRERTRDDIGRIQLRSCMFIVRNLKQLQNAFDFGKCD